MEQSQGRERPFREKNLNRVWIILMTYHRVGNVIIIAIRTRRERSSRGRGECIMHLTGDASVAPAAGELNT